MRAALALALAPALALAILAGCAGKPDASACDAGSTIEGTGIVSGGTGVTMVVDILHDAQPNRDVVVCVQLDEHRPFGVAMEGSNAVPNVRRIAEGTYAAADEIRIRAFIPDDDVSAIRTVPLTAVNDVTIVVENGYALRIDKHDEIVAYA